MQAEAARQDLSRALSQIARVVEARATISILNHVLLTLAAGVLTLRATDLNVEITCTIPATGDDFTACVPAKSFADIVKRLPGDRVTLDIEGTSMRVKAGRSRFNLPILVETVYPTIAVASYDCSFRTDLSALLGRVTFAVGESKVANTDCVFLHAQDDMLRVAGTDIHALAAYAVPLPEGAALLDRALIPARLASLIPKGEVQVEFAPGRLRITTTDATIVGLLVDGSYVQYAKAIPTDHARIVTVSKADLSAAVERIALVSSTVRLNIAPGSIALVGKDSDGREANDEIAVDYHGEPTYLAFACRYVVDMLAATPGDEVEIALTDNTTFTRVRSLSDDAFVGVLSPYRM